MNDKLIRELRSTESNYMLFGHRQCGMSTLLRDVVADNRDAVLVVSGQPKQGVIDFHNLINMPDKELLRLLVGKTLVMDVFMLENIINHMSKLVHISGNIIVGATGRPGLKELNMYLAQGFSVRKLPNIISDERQGELRQMLSVKHYSRELDMDFGGSV